jgi:hypothetical protein
LEEGDVVEVKLIRDKHTGFPAGYGFVEFATAEIAEKVLETCNGNAIGRLCDDKENYWQTGDAGEGQARKVEEGWLLPMQEEGRMLSMGFPSPAVGHARSGEHRPGRGWKMIIKYPERAPGDRMPLPSLLFLELTLPLSPSHPPFLPPSLLFQRAPIFGFGSTGGREGNGWRQRLNSRSLWGTWRPR